MMEALWEMDASLFTGKKDMLRFYRENCVTIGKEISVVGAGEVRHGRALDVDDEGALVWNFQIPMWKLSTPGRSVSGECMGISDKTLPLFSIYSQFTYCFF